ncbi:MAG: histidinol-phosphate transaminase [Ignavibacteriaceae bacterium]|nr:histidinol-phosphate transaminase [Ignavibacteriaceae bacterium]
MIQELIRKNIKDLKPYTSARDIYNHGILLDANENSFGSVVDSSGELLNRYPDPLQLSMRKRLSEYLGVTFNKLFFGVGSDEIIDLLIRIFCVPGHDSIMILEPTYGMYKVAADINDVKSNTILLNKDFNIDTETVINNWNNSIKIIFLCSPNNPTGNLLNKESIRTLLQKINSIIVVDEAYIDFAGEENSCIGLLNEFPNLVLLRTFSKAWGLAAIRLGYCIADEEIINYLFKIKAPYNINSLTRKAFQVAFSNISKKDGFVTSILSEKQFLINELNKLNGIEKIFPSDTNYILIRIKNASVIQKKIADEGIIIRDRSNQPNLENCLRITVGTHDQNIKLISLLQKALNK